MGQRISMNMSIPCYLALEEIVFLYSGTSTKSAPGTTIDLLYRWSFLTKYKSWLVVPEKSHGSPSQSDQNPAHNPMKSHKSSSLDALKSPCFNFWLAWITMFQILGGFFPTFFHLGPVKHRGPPVAAVASMAFADSSRRWTRQNAAPSVARCCGMATWAAGMSWSIFGSHPISMGYVVQLIDIYIYICQWKCPVIAGLVKWSPNDSQFKAIIVHR